MQRTWSALITDALFLHISFHIQLQGTTLHGASVICISEVHTNAMFMLLLVNVQLSLGLIAHDVIQAYGRVEVRINEF